MADTPDIENSENPAASDPAKRNPFGGKRYEGPRAPYMTPIERHKAKPTSWKKAIASHCYSCEGEDADPGWRWRIGNCLIEDCALYSFRPYQKLHGTPMPKALQPEEG